MNYNAFERMQITKPVIPSEWDIMQITNTYYSFQTCILVYTVVIIWTWFENQ